MGERIQHPDGGFVFLKGVAPCSQGVVALPGYAIERVRFRRPLPLAAGFARMAKYLKSLGRPLAAFCACELRSPGPFTPEGLHEFDQGFVAMLRDAKLFRDGLNPVARTSACPALDAPEEPALHAFCHTVRPGDGRASFFVAGSGEGLEAGAPSDPLGTIDARLRGLRVQWSDATVAQLYAVDAIETEELHRRVRPATLAWHWCRPPVEGPAYELDVRGIGVERVLD